MVHDNKNAGGTRPPREEFVAVRYYDWIAHHGRRTPNKVAVIDLASERRFTYSQFDARIARLAGFLRDTLKVSRGDRVAVLALNTTDTLEVQFACFRIGAVFLPLNTRLTVPELQFIVGDSSPKVMVHDDDLAEVALTVAKLCGVASALRFGADGSYEAAIAGSTPLDRAEAAAGELHLKCIGCVQRQHRDAVAARNVQRVAQERGEARDAAVELRIGEAALAREVDDRDLIRRAAPMVDDPVVVTNGQKSLPRRSRAACAPVAGTVPGVALGPAGVCVPRLFLTWSWRARGENRLALRC